MNCISVIIPVYQVEAYLDRCIQSVVDQTYRNLEIILVDDGSTDNSSAICDEWADKEPRIKVLHKENGGPADSRNAGLIFSSGEYIAFVDSDDWIAPQMFELLADALERDKSDIAVCSAQIVSEDGANSELYTVQTNRLLDRLEAQKALLYETLLIQPVWGKLYKRDVIKDILFETDKKFEDNFWSYQVIGNAKYVSIIDYTGYFYVNRTGSIMHSGYSLKALDAIEFCEKRYLYMEDEFPELALDAKIIITQNCIYHGQLVLNNLSGAERQQAFQYLKKETKKYPLRYSEYSNLKQTHRIWLSMSKVSLWLTCSVKNFFNIGF